uniref:Uncharacterized protein n=1 Tax=Fagus sylvatica TaxID=28930 RepID=A0A2N9HG44_FAGSY
MSQMPEPKMVMKLNPGGVVVYTKIEPEKMVVRTEQVPWFNKAKHESVIPTKRRTVKRMMFNQFVQFIAHVLCSRNKTNTIYPHNP